MTIGKRLIVLVAVPLVALLVFGMFARVRLSEIEERSRFVAENQLGSVTALGGIAASFAELRVSVRNTLLAADQSERAAARAAFDENDRTLSQLLQQYGASSISDERDRQLLGRFEDLNRQYIVEARQVIDLADDGRHDEALARFRSTAGPTGVTLTGVASEWIQYNKDLGTSAARAALEAIEQTRSQILVVNLAALVLTGLVGFLTFRRIVSPIQALERSVKAVAAGDYTQSVPFTEATDETGGLARAIDVLKQGAAAIDEQRWVKSSASDNRRRHSGREFPGGIRPAAALGPHALAGRRCGRALRIRRGDGRPPEDCLLRTRAGRGSRRDVRPGRGTGRAVRPGSRTRLAHERAARLSPHRVRASVPPRRHESSRHRSYPRTRCWASSKWRRSARSTPGSRRCSPN